MNKEEIYFKKTPVIEPPKEYGIYFTDEEKCWYHPDVKIWQREIDQEPVYPTYWLQPCSPPDEGAFADWLKFGFNIDAFTEQECIDKGLSTVETLCWRYVTVDNKKYTSTEAYKLFTDQRK